MKESEFMLIDNPFDSKNPRIMRAPRYHPSKDIQIIEIGYNRVPAGLCQMAKRDVYILHYVINGKGNFLGSKFDKNFGYLVVPNEFEKITADKKEPYETYWIVFKGSLAPKIINELGFEKKCCVFPFDRCTECAKILKDAMFGKEYSNDMDEAYSLLSAFYSIIAVHTGTAAKTAISLKQTAKSIAMYIEKSYSREIKITKLAADFNISRSYLYNIFRQTFGVSPQEYLMAYRIEKAKQLLTDRRQSLSVKEVAFSAGFDNPLYFSRIFHKRTGMTPTQFSKENS